MNFFKTMQARRKISKMSARGNGRAKQVVSASRALSMAVIQPSMALAMGAIKADELKQIVYAKLDDIRRQYGLPLCMELIPYVIKKMEKQPYLKVNDNIKKLGEVRLFFGPMQDYYEMMLARR